MSVQDFILSLPQFKESRLTSLYSDFDKLKQLNVEGYQANSSAWKILVTSLIKSETLLSDSQISINCYRLESYLTLDKYGEPKNLPNVLQELVDEGILVPHSVYMHQNTPYFQNGFKTYLSFNSWVQWGKHKVFKYSTTKDGKLVNDRLILLEELIIRGDEIFDSVMRHLDGSYVSKLYDFELLLEYLNTFTYVTKTDLEIYLKYWSRDRQLIQVNQKYIKMSKEAIVEDDVRLIEVKRTLKKLSSRSSQLESKISTIDLKQVVKLPKDQQKIKLRQLLNEKNKLIMSLEKNAKVHDELDSILTKINESSLNHEIFEQMVSSSSILKNLNNKIDLNKVDDAKLDIEEEIAKTEEFNQALSSTRDEDVDEEFNKIVQEEEEKEKLIEKLNNLTVSDTLPAKVQDSPEKERTSHIEKISIGLN